MSTFRRVTVIQEWSEDPLSFADPAPDEVRSTYRFLATIRSLRLIKRNVFFGAISRMKIAKLVIKKLLAEP